MTETTATTDERTPGGAILMDGARLRDEITERLAAKMQALGSPRVCLATVLVGDDRPSQIYVRSKHRQAEKAGMTVAAHRPPAHGQPGRGRGRGRRARRRPRRCTASSCSSRSPTGWTPNRCSTWSRPRRTSTASPSARWAASCGADPGTSPARRRASCACWRATASEVRAAGGRRRPLDAGRPADEPAAGPQGRRRHGHAGPLAHAGPGRGVPGGRHRRRRRRDGPHDHRGPRPARGRR